MLNGLFTKKAAKTEQPSHIAWQDGSRRMIEPTPRSIEPTHLFQKPTIIDLTIPPNHGTRLGRMARTVTLTATLATAAMGMANQLTQDENGVGFFQPQVDAVALEINNTASAIYKFTS